MKNSFLKFLLSICILLTGVYSPLFGNHNIEGTSFNNIQQFTNSITDTQEEVVHHNTSLKGNFDDLDKGLEIEAIEIEEEEESKQTFFKKDTEHQQTTASFYLLSVLFLFIYFTNSCTLQKLFTFLPIADRRFVLYQVFRI